MLARVARIDVVPVVDGGASKSGQDADGVKRHPATAGVISIMGQERN